MEIFRANGCMTVVSRIAFGQLRYRARASLLGSTIHTCRLQVRVRGVVFHAQKSRPIIPHGCLLRDTQRRPHAYLDFHAEAARDT
jgi:hypothetical protein